jgi:hypothetical protein
LSEDKLSELNSLYRDAESADKNLFSEIRSNILLYVGNHYSQKDVALRGLFKELKNVSADKKLRLTKNHLGIICDRLINYTVTGHNPDVVIQEKHKMEVQDRQAAKVATAVWNKVKEANKFQELIEDLAFDFVVGGEYAAFVSFDPNKGEIVDQEVVDEITGEVVGYKKGFTGETTIERWETFNLLRDPQTKNWKDSSFYIYRKMDDVAPLKKQFKDFPEIVEKITKSADETFTVFDSQKGTYSLSGKDKVLTKMILYRPCEEYPDGYYINYTTDVILSEGTLNGIWPLIYRPYTKVSTSPRGFSIIKRLRPAQAEINRIGSCMAESQLNFKDRLVIQNGSKITNGGNVAGAVAIRVTGAAPQIMQGQSGDKYLGVLSAQIEELYQLANLKLEEEEKIPTTDPNALLFASMRHKKKFTQKSNIFESGLRDIVETVLETCKLFYHEAHLIEAVDKKDYINIPEFKNITKLCYSLEVKSSTGDSSEILGQQLSIQHALQYAQGLPAEQVAILVSNLPFLKDSLMAQEITADYRACEDIFASLERGQDVPASKYENHTYMTKRITNRMKESSFRFLDPMIQQLYEARLAIHDQFITEKAAAVARAEAGFIPAGGALIPVALYMDAANASKRVRLPHDALEWLYKKLYEQGALRDEMMGIGNDGAITDVSSLLAQQIGPMDQPQELNTQHFMPNSPQPGEGAFNVI